MKVIDTYLKISRYRFWSYTAGPFALGTVIAITHLNQLLEVKFLLGLLFFLVPFNFFVYSINDFFDGDTDKFNTKKQLQELKYSAKMNKILKWGLVSFALYWVILFLQLNDANRFLLLLLTLISYLYSAPPIRFKTRPFLDSFSNILYALPGFIGYLNFSTNQIPIQILLICIMYTFAMHLFSAIPDIDADTKANLKTTAIVLGEKRSLMVCLLLWLGISIILLSINIPIFILSLIYIVLPLICIHKPEYLQKIYWLFPVINAFVGFMIFWIIVIIKFL